MWFSGGSHAAFYTNCFKHSTMGLQQFWDTHWQGSAKQQKLVGSQQCVFHLFYHHLNIWSQQVFKTQTVHINLYLIPFTWHVYEKISRYTKFEKNVCSLYLHLSLSLSLLLLRPRTSNRLPIPPAPTPVVGRQQPLEVWIIHGCSCSVRVPPVSEKRRYWVRFWFCWCIGLRNCVSPLLVYKAPPLKLVLLSE